MTADDLNRALPLPADTWVLDYHASHAIAGGFAGVDAQAQAGPAFTLIHRGRVAAVWGLVVGRGVAEGWLTADAARIQPIRHSFTRGARRFMDMGHQRLNLRRVQVHVPIANAPFCQWARLIGFEEEARLRRYAPDGSDVLLMARVW